MIGAAGDEDRRAQPRHEAGHEYHLVAKAVDHALHLEVALFTQQFAKQDVVFQARSEVSTDHKDHAIADQHANQAGDGDGPKVGHPVGGEDTAGNQNDVFWHGEAKAAGDEQAKYKEVAVRAIGLQKIQKINEQLHRTE